MQGLLIWFGISSFVYALSRLIHYAELRLEDSNKYPHTQTFLTGVWIVLWVASLPLSLIMWFINRLHRQRLEDKVRTELSKDSDYLNYHKTELIPIELLAAILFGALLLCVVQISTLQNNIEDLKYQISAIQEEAEQQYDNGYDEGRTGAYNEGYYGGYDSGYDDGYSEGYAEKEEMIESWYADGYEDGFKDGFAEASN